MKKTIIYFVVVLCLLSLGLTLVPLAVSQPENIKVVSYSYYVDSLGILDVVGEIQNVGSSTVGSILLTGSVSSSDGTHQADSLVNVWGSDILPQQKAPFYMEFQAPSSGAWVPGSTYRVVLSVKQADSTSNYQYQDLKITSKSSSIDTTTDNRGVYWVSGIIKNTGSQDATSITVLGIFYNSAGTTVAVGYTDFLTPATLVPSATTSFKVGAFDHNETIAASDKKIASYSILVQVQGPILQGTPTSVTTSPTSAGSPTSSQTSPGTSTSANASPTNASSPASSSQTTQPPISNPTSSINPMILYSVVIAIVLIAIAGILLAFRKHKPQAEEETSQT